MGLIRLVAPTVEPLSIDEVRKHLRIDAVNVEPVPGVLTVALAGGGAGNVENGTHRYRCTFVTADGETDGGDISVAVTVVDKTVDGKVAVSAIPLGGTFVTGRRLYRTKAGADVFFLLTTLADNTTVVFLDNVADAVLGVGVPSTNTTGDPELRRLIQSVRETAELYLRRPLLKQTWKYTLDCFPDSDVIRIPLPNLLAVTSFKYIAWDGVLTSVLVPVYTVDTVSFPGQIVRNYAQIWPPALPVRNAIEVQFECGFGTAASDVPEALKAGLKIFAGDLWENRETEVILGRGIFEHPVLHRLLQAYRFEEMA